MQFQFSSLADFFWMSGHGPYVWSSYVIVVLGLVALVILPQVRKKTFIRQQKGILERNQESNID